MTHCAYHLLSFALLVAWADICRALVTPGVAVNNLRAHVHDTAKNRLGSWTPAPLLMQGADDETEATPSNEGKSEVDESAAPEEDPEVTALKEEISKLESELKSRRASLSLVIDQVEEYSKAGYARAVAEMENMRRVRSSMNSSSKSNALAGVLRDFLPVYDRMDSLKEKYISDEFGSKYAGLSIGPTFTKMGVKEFSVQPGAPIDLIRMNVVATEYSEALKDTVIRQVAPGLELEGNVIRAAACISSMGTEGEPTSSQASEEVSN
mmetsp:Transcript_85616/g.247112  ORF Transcript_85616/g.247112 Transcript_85616/m.247112 type:complete len:266 (+) Transcript_85616:100-897(+)